MRVARVTGDRLAVGRSLPGRGAWLCAGSPGCVDEAVRRGAFARVLRGPVDPASVAAVRAQVATGVPGTRTPREDGGPVRPPGHGGAGG